ncbi:unnamed protein product [Durusdinium trenchii]|uniref:Uncharacterized protein n=1 Tax=Durusdinium trenchii TaxID=1381693 RepID=A0ABP0JXH2_9DINO
MVVELRWDQRFRGSQASQLPSRLDKWSSTLDALELQKQLKLWKLELSGEEIACHTQVLQDLEKKNQTQTLILSWAARATLWGDGSILLAAAYRSYFGSDLEHLLLI